MNSVAKGLALSLLLLAAAACGDNAPPPATPETPPASEMVDSGADMPATGDSAGADAGAAAEAPPPPPKPAALDLPAASAKLKVKLKGKDTEIEIKNDGTVNTAGKPTHKLSGMELQDKDGKGLLKVDNDGNVTTADGAAYAKFEGDDLTAADASKITVADDGVSQTDAKGKKTALGKAEGIGSAKKASALVVGFSVWGNKPPKAKAAPKK